MYCPGWGLLEVESGKHKGDFLVAGALDWSSGCADEAKGTSAGKLERGVKLQVRDRQDDL